MARWQRVGRHFSAARANTACRRVWAPSPAPGRPGPGRHCQAVIVTATDAAMLEEPSSLHDPGPGLWHLTASRAGFLPSESGW